MAVNTLQSVRAVTPRGASPRVDVTTLESSATPQLFSDFTDHWAFGSMDAGNGLTGVNGLVMAAVGSAATFGTNSLTTAAGSGTGYKCSDAAVDDSAECTHMGMAWRPASASATVMFTNSLNNTSPSGGGSGVGISTVSTFNRLQDYTRGFYQSIRNPVGAAFPAEIPVNAPFVYGMSIRKVGGTVIRQLLMLAPGPVLYAENNDWPGRTYAKVVATAGRGFSVGSTDLTTGYTAAIKIGQAAYIKDYGMTHDEMVARMVAMREIAIARGVTGF